MPFSHPFHSLKAYPFSYLRRDLPASLSVFLVALPLGLGIALASGAPLFAGLVAGIIGGTVVGGLSGSEISVSGPAAGLAVLVADAITKVGSYEAFLVAVVLAGVVQLALGVLKAGRFSSFFPDSVIKGMLVAIGLVIILKQIPHALGRDNDYEGEFEFAQLADGENTVSEIYRALVTASPGAVVISLVSLAFLVVWERTARRSTWTFFKNFPPALAVVLVGVGLNQLFRLYRPDWYLGATAIRHMVQIPTLAPGQSIASIFDFPDFSALTNPRIYGVAVTLALVASLETLLNLEASERLDPDRRLSAPNQELVAQGVGNMLSGLVGGLPITSFVVRTSANVYGGNKTRLSSMLHGVWLLLAVALAGALLNFIPLSCLAVVLIMVGYKLARPAIFASTYKQGVNQFIPFIITVLGIIFTDLLIGVLLGTVIGLFFVLYTNFQSSFRVIRDENRVLIKIQKDLHFLSKPQLRAALSSLRPGDQILVDGSNASFIDQDIYHLILGFSETAIRQGMEYELKNVTPNKRRLLQERHERSPKAAAGQ